MNQIAQRPLPWMTTDDFLAWPGDGSGRTFQLVDGEVRPVSPASRTHGVIQARMAYLLSAAIDAGKLPLQVMTEGAIIPALNASTNVRVPDLVVAAADDERGQQTVPEPIVVVEVLSPGNADDTRDNARALSTLPSLREIVVLHSTRVRAELHRRTAGGSWAADPVVIGPGERLALDSIGFACPLDDAYATSWLGRTR